MVRQGPERGPTFNHILNISKNNVALRALRKKYENAVIPLGSKLFSVDRKGIHLS